jgi:hypothetical protein
MTGDYSLAALHPHAHDVDELGVFGEQLPELLGILCIECIGERLDDGAWRGEGRHVMSPIKSRLLNLILPSAFDR